MTLTWAFFIGLVTSFCDFSYGDDIIIPHRTVQIVRQQQIIPASYEYKTKHSISPQHRLHKVTHTMIHPHGAVQAHYVETSAHIEMIHNHDQNPYRNHYASNMNNNTIYKLPQNNIREKTNTVYQIPYQENMQQKSNKVYEPFQRNAREKSLSDFSSESSSSASSDEKENNMNYHVREQTKNDQEMENYYNGENSDNQKQNYHKHKRNHMSDIVNNRKNYHQNNFNNNDNTNQEELAKMSTNELRPSALAANDNDMFYGGYQIMKGYKTSPNRRNELENIRKANTAESNTRSSKNFQMNEDVEYSPSKNDNNYGYYPMKKEAKIDLKKKKKQKKTSLQGNPNPTWETWYTHLEKMLD